MSGDGYVPLHWQRDPGGAQADENLRLLEWAQRTREARLGQTAAETDDEATDGDSCAEGCP